MPKIGNMVEVSNTETGEIFYNADTEIRELRKLRLVPNTVQTGEGAPEYLIKLGGRVVGAMWDKGPDRNGNKYYKLRLNGYPLSRELWLWAFFEAPGRFMLDYSAPRAPRAQESEAA